MDSTYSTSQFSLQAVPTLNTHSLWVHFPSHQGQQVCVRHRNGAIGFLICRAETTETELSLKNMLQLRGICSLTEKNGSSLTLKRQRYFNTENGTEGSFVNPLYWIQEDWKTLNHAHTAAQFSHQYHCERSLCRFSRPQTKLPPFHLGRPLR